MKTLARALMIMACGCVAADEPPSQTWPEISQTARPWTRWWWPGSAVEREPLAAQLREFAAAGIGGVEITPIYGARGGEQRDVEFLSTQWAELLAFTASEAGRLGLGVDMATGTGWPFGGPEVSVAQGSSFMVLLDGRLVGKPTEMKVKRAAPGGAGLVLDPYSTDALESYLERFTKALQGLPAGGLRGQFHDSFEYYNAGWSPALPREFLALNGYDIQTYAREIMGEAPLDADTLGRLKGDYRRTLAKMHLDYAKGWVNWSHAHGFKARNQAHGAPGNLLDLYAAADIPETESYGMTPLPIPGFRAEADNVNPDPDPPENLIARFASSAAHVAGKPLASSETLTWLRENFREAPWAAKPQIDRLFAAGINHIFYHGTSYTPADAAWPGWYFYASTQLNPNNPLWPDYAAMNAYVARVQSILQAGRPDNDVLIYWPFDDLVDNPEGQMRQLGVHENKWLIESPAGKLAIEVLHAGHGFDFISDAQIAQLRLKDGHLVTPAGGRYRALVIPRARRIALSTLMHVQALAQQRGRSMESPEQIVFEELPDDVPGFGQLEARRRQFQQPVSGGGTVTRDVISWLDRNVSAGEPASRVPLAWQRRARADGFDYFFANLTGKDFDGWLQLARPADAALLLDPLTGRAGVAALRTESGMAHVYLQLAGGQSTILRTYGRKAKPRGSSAWQYTKRAGEGQPVAGEWQVAFLRGGPALPAPLRLPELRDWTALEDPALASFAGTARYRIEFDSPARRADAWQLELGDVREAARVRLNGEEVGHAWSLPFTLRLPGKLKPKGNVLEIEVTNLPANRIRDLDLRNVDWKVMKEINLVTLRYKPFDASGWQPAPSGLLGPVRLVPLEVVRPR